MCGIHAAIYAAGACPKSAALERRLRNRGPDHQGTVTTCLESSDHGHGHGHDHDHATTLAFTSTVLSLRGDHVARQPLVDQVTGSVLCWNGEAWKIRGREVHGNDGEAVMSLLVEASRSRTCPTDDDGSSVLRVLRVLRDIEGPFAFIYYDKAAGRLFYGRDRLGRRSLLVKTGDPFVLASIADDCAAGEWAEVEADGIYVLELPGPGAGDGERPLGEYAPSRHDWVDDDSF
ncbi:hypothetical protein E4U43_002258, partial [Claviceps pusilla]